MLRLCALHLAQNARELYGKDNRTADGGGSIGDSLGGIYAGHTQKMGKDKCQRNEENNLTQQGYEDRNLGLSQCDEHVLAGALQTEDGHTSQKDWHDLFYGRYQFLVARKGRCYQRREEDHEQYQHEVEGEHDGQHDSEAFFQSFLVVASVVIARNGDKSLGESCQRNTYNEHGTLHDGQCADVDISEFFQTAVQYNRRDFLYST